MSSDQDWAQIARGPEAFDEQPAGPDEVQQEVSDDEVEEVHELTDPEPEPEAS